MWHVSCSARGGLNPILGLCFPLFSMLFPGRISIKVETCGTGRKQKCGLLWRLYIQVFICIGRSAFPRGYQKSQFNGVLSAPHSFARPNAIRFAILFNVGQKADFLLLGDSRGLFASGRRSSTGENRQSDESGKQRIESPRGMRV